MHINEHKKYEIHHNKSIESFMSRVNINSSKKQLITQPLLLNYLIIIQF